MSSTEHKHERYIGVEGSTDATSTRKLNAALLAMGGIVRMHLRVSDSWLALLLYADPKDLIPQLSPPVLPIWLQTPQARLCLTEMSPS